MFLNTKQKIFFVFSIVFVLNGCSSNPSASYSHKNANINISQYGVNINSGVNYNIQF